jgi:hypothetical protein
MAQNANGDTHITAEPLFYGERRHTRGVTAEDFVTKLRSLRAGFGIADPQMVARSVGYFREAAASWWYDSLEFMEVARKRAATTDFEAFITLFKDEYFRVTTLTDLSGDYSALKQRIDETASDFMTRAAAAFAVHARLRPDLESTQEARDGLMEAVAAIVNAADGRNFNALPDDLKQGMLLAERNHWVRAVRAERNDFLGDIGAKIVCQGLRSPKHQELIRKWEREGKSFTDITKAFKQVEKDAANRPTPGVIPKTSIPAVIKAAEGNDDDDEEVQAEIAAVKKQGKGKKAKKTQQNQQNQQKQGASGNNSLPQKQKGGPNANFYYDRNGSNFNNSNNSRPRNANPTRPCSHCQNHLVTDPTKWHWDSSCPSLNHRVFPRSNMSAGGEINADAHAIGKSYHLNS